MELKRELIERKDFPQVRRGFDPQAVQDHLYEVAKAVAEVKHGDTAAATGAWVTAIVDAAERAAQEMEQTARADAERMRSSAKAAAETTLARAKNEAETTLSSAKAQAEKTVTSANANAHQTLSSAKAESESTLTNARNEAASTLSTARAEANSTLTSAKTESERMLASARKEADSILSSARAEAASTRASSRAQAQEHVERVEQSVLRLLDRANAVQGDLGKLVADASGSISKLAETVRSGADKLRADLDVPREERSSGRFARDVPSGGDADAKEDRPAVVSPKPAPAAAKPAEEKPVAPATMSAPASQPAGAKPAAPAASAFAAPVRPAAPAASPLTTPKEPVPPSPATADPPRMERGAAEAARQPETQRPVFGRPAPPAPPAAPAAGSGTSGVQAPGADPRLEAFNMAKSGASPEEVARHLKVKFGLEDPQAIITDAFLRSGR